MRAHEYHISRLETQVSGGVASYEIIVDVEFPDFLSAAAQADRAEGAVVAGTTSCVQRGHQGARARDAITARADHIADDKDLVTPKLGDRDLEVCGRGGSLLHSRVHAPEASVEQFLELGDGQVGHRDLPDLRNQHEPFAGHVKRLRRLNLTRQDEYQAVPRPKAVGRIDRAVEIWLELCLRRPEQIRTEDWHIHARSPGGGLESTQGVFSVALGFRQVRIRGVEVVRGVERDHGLRGFLVRWTHHRTE